MDYFQNLPHEIKEIIFKYLNLSDLLNLCLTSKCLNEAIGQSKGCMNLIWIKFYSFNMKDLESLNESERCYEKLKINRINRDDHFQFLIDLQPNWKKVLIYNCEFKHFQTFYDIINSLSNKIEELEISDIEILSYDDVQLVALKFPSLKRLMFRNMPLRAIEIFLQSSDRLENAAFDIAQALEGNSLHDIIYNILNASPKLKQLQLGPQYIKSLFGEKNKSYKFPFMLKNLLLKFPIVNDLPETADETIASFLITQPKIEWLVLMELQNDNVLSTSWNNLKCLNRISLIGLEELFNNDMLFEIQSNLKISQVDLISRKVLISQLRKLLKAAPYLQILHVKTLNKHMMEFIAKIHSNIHTIFYEFIDEDVMEIYQLIKATDDVNKNIQLIQQSFWFNNSNPFSQDPTFWRLN